MWCLLHRTQGRRSRSARQSFGGDWEIRRKRRLRRCRSRAGRLGLRGDEGADGEDTVDDRGATLFLGSRGPPNTKVQE